MKNIARYSLVALLMAAPVAGPWHTAQAQITHTAQGDVDKAASAILDKAAKKMNQSVSFKVQLQILDPEKRPVADESVLVRYSGGKYHIILPDIELYCDGTTLWQLDKQANEVAVNSAEGDTASGPNLLNPASFLSGYNRHFRAKYIRTEDDGTAVVDLQPRKAQYYHKIRLLVDEASGLLRRAEVQRFDSGREIYTLSDFRRINHKNSEFVFNPDQYPGVEVVDMR